MMRSLALALRMLAIAALGAQSPAPVENPRVVLDTELGQIEIELDAARAPATVANFLRYVDGGFYQGGRFYRTVRTDPDNQPDNDVKIDVVQGTINPARRRDRFTAIPLERTSATGLHHVNGTVRGLDVVREIQQGPADGQTLSPSVKILSVRRVHEE